MRISIAVATCAAMLALAGGQAFAGTATPAARAADCNFDRAQTYDRFGDLHVFAKDGKLFGCATDVGSAYRLAAHANSRRPLFGRGDWIGYAAERKVRALNASTGSTQRARTPTAATAVVVNADGTLTWIAGGVLRTKRPGEPPRRLGSGADPDFLGLELEGCAVTWKVDGEQRSSSVYCRAP